MVLAFIPLRTTKDGDFDVPEQAWKGLSQSYKKHPMPTAQVR